MDPVQKKESESGQSKETKEIDKEREEEEKRKEEEEERKRAEEVFVYWTRKQLGFL